MTASLKQRNFLLAIYSMAIAVFLCVLVIPQSANAREFSPELNVELNAYGEGPFGGGEHTAGAAPGMEMTLTRDRGEQFPRNLYMNLPPGFRVNQLALIERCDLPPENFELGFFRNFQENCPGSDAGDVEITVFNEELPLTGKIYVVNSRQFFSKEENVGLRNEFIGSQDDLNANIEQQLPVVFYLVIGNRAELANSAIPMLMRTNPQDLSIEVFMRDMPPEMQIGLRSMVASLYAGPAAGGDTSGTSAGLLRTPPKGCDRDHVFEAQITSWADNPRLLNPDPEQTVASNPKVKIDGCDQVEIPYGPGMTYSVDTSDAGQSPTLAVNMTRSDPETATTGLRMQMPAHVLGSPLAAFPCVNPNLGVKNPADVCPASTLVGDVKMQATLFFNEQKISALGRVFICPTAPGDLITLCVAFKMPPIAGNQIYMLKTGLSVYGDLEGVEAVLDGLPPEFSITKIEMSFFGNTGANQSPPHPLLLLPSDCSPSTMSVVFESELGQHKAVDRPFRVTRCDRQPFDAEVSVSPTTMPPQSVPEVSIETRSAFRAATMKNLRVTIPGGFTINRQGGLTPCAQEVANQRGCGAESLVAEVEAETPLLEPLTGRAYIVNPPPDRKDVIKQMQIVIDPPAGLEGLTIDLRGEIVKNQNGAGFVIVMKDMPQVSISLLKMKMPGGKDKGLLETPLNCGVYNYKAQAESHSGKTISKTIPITIKGKGCESRLIAGVTPKNPKAKSKLKIVVVPNKGKANLRRVEIGFGKSKSRRISVKTKRKKSSSKKKRKSRKASVARKSKSKKKRSKSKSTKTVGSIKLTFQKGRAKKANLVASSSGRLSVRSGRKCVKRKGKKRKGKKRKGKKRRCARYKNKSIGALSNVKLKVTKKKVTVSGLPANKRIRQLRIELGGEKSKKLTIRNPKRRGNLYLTGRYLHADGGWMKSTAKVRISGKTKKSKKKKCRRTKKSKKKKCRKKQRSKSKRR